MARALSLHSGLNVLGASTWIASTLSLMPPMKFLFQSRWRNSQLAVPNLAHHVRGKKGKREKKKTTHIHSWRPPPPSSNPLSLPIYPRHHPGSAPPLFFLSASLIIRQTHLFPINKPLSLRAGEEMVECRKGVWGEWGRFAEIGATRRKGIEINTRHSWRVEVIKKTGSKNWGCAATKAAHGFNLGRNDDLLEGR